MFEKIKNKVCEVICKIIGVTPCLCSHKCDCKNAKEKK